MLATWRDVAMFDQIGVEEIEVVEAVIFFPLADSVGDCGLVACRVLG
jgi:hypothetical protein